MDFLPNVVPNFSPNETSRKDFDDLIDRNRVSKQLRQFGYSYISIITGFPAIHPYSGDLVIQAENGGTLFETALLQRTPITDFSFRLVVQGYAK